MKSSLKPAYHLKAWKRLHHLSVYLPANSWKAELALFISLFKYLSKMLQDDFDDIKAVESILEEHDLCDIDPKADEVMGILENRVACK